MLYKSLPKNHQTRIVYFGCPHLRSISASEYFNCLKSLRPLFKDSDFYNSVAGFYINSAPENSGEKRISLRITYFTTNPLKTRKIIKNFEKRHSKDIKIYSFNLPIWEEVFKFLISFLNPKECNDEDLRFNKFLNAYTQISLELLENFGRDCSRRLVADYRLNYNPHHRQLWGTSPKEFFESVFNKHSQFFRELNNNYSAEQLWEDLKRAETGSRGVWLHYLVNMLLTLDLNPYGSPIPAGQKRSFLNDIELDMPDNWQSDCDF